MQVCCSVRSGGRAGTQEAQRGCTLARTLLSFLLSFLLRIRGRNVILLFPCTASRYDSHCFIGWSAASLCCAIGLYFPGAHVLLCGVFREWVGAVSLSLGRGLQGKEARMWVEGCRLPFRGLCRFATKTWKCEGHPCEGPPRPPQAAALAHQAPATVPLQ